MEIEPYLSVLGSPWPNTDDIDVPGKRVVVAADVDTWQFKKHAKIGGYFKSKYLKDQPPRTHDGRLWWEDGLQSEVCHTVHIITDDPNSGIYCGFCAQNHPDYFMLLGKLVDVDSFTEAYRNAFLAFGIVSQK